MTSRETHEILLLRVLKGIYWGGLLLVLAAFAMLARDVWLLTNLIFDRREPELSFYTTFTSRIISYNLDWQFEGDLELSLPRRDRYGFFEPPSARSSLEPRSLAEYVTDYHLADRDDRNALTIGRDIRLTLRRDNEFKPTIIEDLRHDGWPPSSGGTVIVVDRSKLELPASELYRCSRMLFAGEFKRPTTKLYKEYFPLAVSPETCSYLSTALPARYSLSDLMGLMRLTDHPMRFDMLRVGYWFFYLEENGRAYSSFQYPTPRESIEAVWKRLNDCSRTKKEGGFGCGQDVPFNGTLKLDTSGHLLETFWKSRSAPEEFARSAERYMYGEFKLPDPQVHLHIFLALDTRPILVTVPSFGGGWFADKLEHFLLHDTFVLGGDYALAAHDDQRWWDFYWKNLTNAAASYRISIGRSGISIWTSLLSMIVITSGLITWVRVKRTVGAGSN